MRECDATERLSAARAAFARRDWATARECFASARELHRLDVDDLIAFADSAWWLGRIDESLSAYERAFGLLREAGERRRASLVALTITYTLSLRGEDATASGWANRAIRLLEDEPPGAEHGYLRYMDFESAVATWDLETALSRARETRACGERFRDPNLVALGLLGEGRVRIKQGDVEAGMALLDEAMLGAISDELEPSWAGNIYCHLMIACHELADLRRAAEWTAATARWCASMPGAGPFMGICRVHRAQLLDVQGAWDEAEREAIHVAREMAHFRGVIVAEAHYQLGEIHRHRGALASAEESFRTASRLGREPQPGLALLRLAQGRIAAALSSIRGATAAETRDRLAQARLAAAEVEIALAAGAHDTAAAAAGQLEEIARVYASSGLAAMALFARGAVLLASDRPGEAVAALRDAHSRWQDADAHYEAARVRALLARACAALGDAEGAALERDAAADAFRRLGMSDEAARAAGLHVAQALPGGVTEREAEVLGLVAAGYTNRDIARTLVISEKTVARHLSNIFTKLDISSRTAAAAFAFEHGLAHPRAR